MKKDGIKVKGHRGTWYVIDEKQIPNHGTVYLLEHEQHGDDTLCVAINKEGELLMEDVSDGLQEVMNYLDAGEEAEAKALDAIEARNRDMSM